MSPETITSSSADSRGRAEKSFSEFEASEFKKELRVPETADTVDAITETDIEAPDGTESPKSLFAQAYEKIMNSDRVLNARDNLSIWWKGGHIDAIEKDIQRLEALASAQSDKVGEHERRLQTSSDAASKLAEIRKGLGIKEADSSHVASREEEYAAVKGRAESHATTAENINRELAKKRELKAKFESDREEARGRVADRFQRKIDTNNEAIQNIDSENDQIQQNLAIADNIVSGLRTKQQEAQGVMDNPNVLPADKRSAGAIAQELEGRIQDVQSKIQLQREAMKKHETKKEALGTQKRKWEALVKKEEPKEELTGEEKTDSFAAETEDQMNTAESKLIGEDGLDSEQPKEEEKDPRVAMLEGLQAFMKDSDFKKYDDPDFQELVREEGTPEQKLLLRSRGFFGQLFKFIESPEKSTRENDETKQREAATAVVMSEREYEYEEMLGSLDDSYINTTFNKENIERVERGEGTQDQRLLMLFWRLIESIFADYKKTEGENKKPKL